MRNVFLFPAALATVVATLPGAAALAKSTTCATSVVCAEFINNFSGGSGGVAIHGEADSGIGVRGTSVTNTGFYGASGSGTYLAPGVEGESTNSGTDAGGGFGLAGLASGGTFPYFGAVGIGRHDGLIGETYTGGGNGTVNVGVAGYDLTSGFGNAGVAGMSTNGTAGLFLANASRTAPEIPVGVFADAEPSSPSGAIGVDAVSESIPLYAFNAGTSTYAELATSTELIIARTTSGKSFSIDTNGNEAISGTLTTSKGTYIRTTGGSGTPRVAYGARTTTPQIEDVGEAALVNGRAVVAIDPDLADSIDMRRAYHVFLTPDGECNGLYVAQKGPRGFVVRELHAGRSNLSFDYRIVAKPVDENGERLAHAAALTEPAHPPFSTSLGKRGTALLSPEARLKQRLGLRGYDKLIAELSRRIAGR